MTQWMSCKALKRRRRFHAAGDRLESRITLSGMTFFVTTALDADAGSLRLAIIAADLNPGSTIDFNIRNGPATINLASPLPQITAPTTIDGTSQPGYKGTPLVTVNGSSIVVAPSSGFDFETGSSGSTIRGLEITGFNIAAITVNNASNITIGGPTSGLGNVISGNPGQGVALTGAGTSAVAVEGNNIGTDSSGTVALANGIGVSIVGATANTIGGTVTGARNVIAGNTTLGVEITGSAPSLVASLNVVEGNFIGTNAAGKAALANGQAGVSIDGSATNNTIGGSLSSALNVISGNTNAGVAITGSGSNGNTVAGNEIGTDSSGAVALANGIGVSIVGATANTIGGTAAGSGNVIAFNTGAGVGVAAGTGDAIHQNLVFGNGAGIVLAAGGNNSRAAPTVLAAASVPNLTTIDYQVTGTLGQVYTIEFFASSALGSPAAKFLGSVTTPALSASTQSFTATFSLASPIPPGQTVTATATSTANDTSAFATSVGLASPFQVTNTTDQVPGSEVGSLRQVILDANDSPPPLGTDDITFAIPGTAPFVISPAVVLPSIAVPVTIDGTTERGVQLNGGGRAFDGLTLGGGSGGSTITGLNISNFNGAGIHIESSGDTITDNQIGTSTAGAGSGPGNNVGILIDGPNGGSGATIGGTTAADANTIGFNTSAGVSIGGAGAKDNVVIGNKIGTDSVGDDLGNLVGVSIGASDNTIGKAGAGNTIGFNTKQGIALLSGTGNVVSQDQYNGTNGPTSPVQANDISLSAGANNNQPAPTLASVSYDSATSQLLLEAWENSATPPRQQTLEIYLVTSGQRTFQISTLVTLSNNPSNLTPVSVTVPGLAGGDLVIATVTDPTNGTSAFSATASIAGNNVVTNTNDSGPGSLRAVIGYANANPNATVVFNIPGTSPFVIDVTSGVLPTISARTTIDGTTESLFLGQPAVVQINGGGHAFDGLTLGTGSGDSTVKGLQIVDFAGAGIHVESSGDTVVDNLIGTDGNPAHNNVGNQVGIFVDGANGGSAATIGGTTSSAANIIGFNTTAGVSITANGNLVAGNYIGTNSAGQNLGNVVGVSSTSASNTIGGTVTAARNVISGNTNAGVAISGAGASGDTLAGNFIGTDASGQSPLGNGIGVLVSGGAPMTIGGTTPGAGNVISGNFTAGIELDGGTVSGIQILGNLIGTDPTGSFAVVRSGQSDPLQARQNAGVVVIGSQGNTIGGDSPATRNLISGNYVGVMLATITGQGNPNFVLGNRIGTDISGENSVGNIVGVYINGAAGNQIGGTGAGSANIISGNSSVGVEIYGSASTANVIEGNTIGLAANGRGVFRDSRGQFTQREGIFIQNASSNMIGGTAGGAGNVISGNESAGVFIQSHSAISSGNSVDGNDIGLGPGGSPGPGNNGYGIVLFNAPNNPIGRAGAAVNHFGRNGIANIRDYAGPVRGSQLVTAASRSRGRKATHPAGPAHRFRVGSAPARKGRIAKTDHRR